MDYTKILKNIQFIKSQNLTVCRYYAHLNALYLF